MRRSILVKFDTSVLADIRNDMLIKRMTAGNSVSVYSKAELAMLSMINAIINEQSALHVTEELIQHQQ